MDVIKKICHRLAVMVDGRIAETVSLAHVFNNKDSIARDMLYAQLSPQLPKCLSTRLANQVTDKPLIRIFFQGEEATVPFISQTSRHLNMDINILLANIDRFDGVTCGVLVVELTAPQHALEDFITCCHTAGLTVEVLGYVVPNGI